MISKIIDKTAFPKVFSVVHELKKVAILRVLLGIIIFVRFLEIELSIISVELTYLSLFGIFILFMIVLFILGIVTPIATLALIIGTNLFDLLVGTATLGTNILTQMLIVMLLINHGVYGSIDNIFLNKDGKFSSFLKRIYNILGSPTQESIRVAYFLGFLAYALTSCGALILHFYDPYWLQGLTLQSALTNSYLFKFYDDMRYFEKLFPNLLYMASAGGIVIQSIFQIFMIPLIFLNLGRKFIIIWGFIFFFISLVGINLSYLPHVEILFWLMIFFTIDTSDKKISILYDDKCGLCTKGIRFFSALNFNGRYNFIPISKSKELYENRGFSETEVYTYMVGWKDTENYIGFNLYIEMFKINPMLWIFLPFIYIGKINNIGSIMYKYIATNRYKIFGTCTINNAPVIRNNFSYKDLLRNSKILQILQYLALFMFVIFVVVRYPIGIKEDLNKYVYSGIKKGLYFIGLTIPNVFNYRDLTMGNKWMVVYKENRNNTLDIVPIIGIDGHRMSYGKSDILNFSNHNSDYLYFGTTLKYRRAILDLEDNEMYLFHTTGIGFANIEKRINYDYYINKLNIDTVYHVDLYKNTSSIIEPWNVDLNRHKGYKSHTFKYIYNGEKLILLDYQKIKKD